MNKIRFRGPTTPLQLFLAMLDIYFLFFPQALKSFTRLEINQNRSNLVNQLSLAVDQIYMDRDDIESRFSYAQILGMGEGGGKGER